MKKLLACAAACIFLLALTACGSKTEQQPAETEVTTEAEVTQELTAEEAALEEQAVPEPVIIPDAAVYRGTLTKMEETENGKVITLEQAAGSDYGAASRQFVITENTQQTYNPEELETGFYLEVFFNEGEQPEAIAVNIRFVAEAVNFNGTLQEITWDELHEGWGRLVMTDMNTGETIEFNFQQGETTFFVDLDSLKAGDKLNIYHRGMYTMSIPAQGSAVEVRTYAE